MVQMDSVGCYFFGGKPKIVFTGIRPDLRGASGTVDLHAKCGSYPYIIPNSVL